jgi:rod shape-determining protein MreC
VVIFGNKELVIRRLFVKKTSKGMRAFTLLVLSLFLFCCDHRFHCFSGVRYQLSVIVVFVQRLVNLPTESVQAVSDYFVSKKDLLESNKQLRSQLLLVNTDLQRLSFLQHENEELRALLNVSRQNGNKVLTAKLMTLATDNFIQYVTIDRGEQYGVYVGQPVLDAYGLLGQVVIVKPKTSTVMLVTDNKSAVPVMVVRSGLQAIVVGTGSSNYLELANVPETADIKVGDSLVTSGLGQIFPAGYQVGVVREVKRVSGERFMKIFVTPEAHINRSLHVFLVSGATTNLSSQKGLK